MGVDKSRTCVIGGDGAGGEATGVKRAMEVVCVTSHTVNTSREVGVRSRYLMGNVSHWFQLRYNCVHVFMCY